MAFTDANLQRFRNALEGQKSAGASKSRGFGAIRSAVTGAGKSILDVLGRKDTMRHDLELQKQGQLNAEALENLRQQHGLETGTAKYEHDVNYLEKKAQAEAEAEGKKIQYLRDSGNYQYWLLGLRAGNPAKSPEDRNTLPVLDWLEGVWDSYLMNHPNLTTIDPDTREEVFAAEDVKWENVKAYMVLAMQGDKEMQKEFVGTGGVYDPAAFEAYIDGWIATMRAAAEEGADLSKISPAGSADAQPPELTGNVFQQFGQQFSKDVGQPVTDWANRVAQWMTGGRLNIPGTPGGTLSIDRMPREEKSAIDTIVTQIRKIASRLGQNDPLFYEVEGVRADPYKYSLENLQNLLQRLQNANGGR